MSGPIPYGFALGADGVQLLEAPDELQAVEMIRNLRRQGWSTRRIGCELDARSLRAKTGGTGIPRW